MCRSLVKISVMLLSILNRWALRQLVYANSINHTFRKYSWQMSWRVLLRQWNNRNLSSPHLKAMNFENPSCGESIHDIISLQYIFPFICLLFQMGHYPRRQKLRDIRVETETRSSKSKSFAGPEVNVSSSGKEHTDQRYSETIQSTKRKHERTV